MFHPSGGGAWSVPTRRRRGTPLVTRWRITRARDQRAIPCAASRPVAVRRAGARRSRGGRRSGGGRQGGRGAHGGHLRRVRLAHPAPPGPEPAGRPAAARRPHGRAHRAGRGHARGVHDVVRAARPADRPRPADERDHRRLVVRVADRGHRAEPRVPQGRPGQDRRRQGRPEGHRRGGARDGRRCAGAARARAAAGPARLAAGRADPAGQRHHRHGCAEHDEPGGGDPRRDAGPGERAGRRRPVGGGPGGEAARLRQGRARRHRRPAGPGRERVRGVRWQPVERVGRHLGPAVGDPRAVRLRRRRQRRLRGGAQEEARGRAEGRGQPRRLARVVRRLLGEPRLLPGGHPAVGADPGRAAGRGEQDGAGRRAEPGATSTRRRAGSRSRTPARAS